MILLLLAQLFLGTPHPVVVDWPGILVTDTNDDGSAFSRPPLGYWVLRAQIVNGVAGSFSVLNLDSAVQGTMSDGVDADPCEYVDFTAQSGLSYTYQVIAEDFNGEAASGQSNTVQIPLNPNAPTNVQITVGP